MATIEQLTVADDAANWERVGFAVDGDTCRIGGVALRFAGRDAGRGIVGWTLRGAKSGALDGLTTTLAAAASGAPADAVGKVAIFFAGLNAPVPVPAR